MNLTLLQPGQSAEIQALNVELPLQRRLNALGLYAGKQVLILRKSWLAGPLHIRVGSTELMLRRRDAEAIAISLPLSPAAPILSLSTLATQPAAHAA